MPDSRMQKLADVLVNYSTKVKQGDWVHINASYLALPLAKEVMSSVLKAGGNPSVALESPDMVAGYIAEGNEEQLRWTPPLDMHIIEKVDVWIIIEAPENTRAMTNIDPERQQMRNSAYAEWMDIYMKRSASGELRWVMTNYPCQALAQDAEMSLGEYEDFVYAATFADQGDAVKRWQEIFEEQEKLIKWLAGKKTVTIRGPHVDLSMSIEGRSFVNSSGDQNMPSGEIFTSPVEDSVIGWVEFFYPAIYQGVAVEGVRLEFEQGKIIKAGADKGEAFLLKMLDTDEGARILGELGIGTNYGIQRFTKNILYDEKIGGTFHLAVGSGFPEAGGGNESSIHWDLISDARKATTMWADDEIFYKDGKFTL